MRAAIVYGDTVANIIEAESLESAEALFPGAEVIEAGVVAPGWVRSNGVFSPPAPPAPAARVILAGWFKAALARLNHTAAVNAAVSSQPLWKQELWNNATHIREDDTDVVAIATALNINLASVFDEADRIRAETRG